MFCSLKTALKNTLDTLTERVPELIPPEGATHFLNLIFQKIGIFIIFLNWLLEIL